MGAKRTLLNLLHEETMNSANLKRLRTFSITAMLILFQAASFASVENWHTIQSNPQHTGSTETQTFRSAPEKSWEAETVGSLFGSPIIRADGSVIVSTGTENKVMAFSAEGEPLWSYEAAGAIYGSPAVLSDGKIAFGDFEGFIYTLNSDGTLDSSVQTTPAQVEKRILADMTQRPNGGYATGDWRGKLIFNSGSGNLENGLPSSVYPAAAVTFSSNGSQAFFAYREGNSSFYLRCVNPTTAGTIWQVGPHLVPVAGIVSPPAPRATLNMSAVCLDEEAGRIYTIAGANGKDASTGSYLYAFSSSNGALDGDFPVALGAGSYCTPALAPDGTALYVTTLDGRLLKIDSATGATMWTYNSGAQMIRGSAVVDGQGRAIFGDMSGVVHCVNSAGVLEWRYDGDGSTIASSPAIAPDGSVVMGATNGKVFKLDQPVIPYLEGQTPTLDGVLSPGEYQNAWHVTVRADKDPGINPGWDYKDGGLPPAELTTDDCSYEMYVFHNGTDLYIALDVNDEVVRFDESPNPPASWTASEYIKNVWWDDCTEVFIDADCDNINEGREGTASTLPTELNKLHFWQEGVHFHLGVLGHIFTKPDNLIGFGETYHKAWWTGVGLRSGGYVHEYRLKLSEFDKEDGAGFTPLAPGDEIGFNTCANDDDLFTPTNDRREDMLVWWGSEFDTNTVPQKWPRVLLSATPLIVDSFTLTYTAGPGGAIQGTNPQTVAAGADGTPVTAVPDTGYDFVKWSDDVLTATRTDVNVQSDIDVTAQFAIKQYSVNFVAGANGTITGSASQNVNHGANAQAVTANPNAGYHFVDWTLNGLPFSTANPLTVSNVTQDMMLTANFARDTGSLKGIIMPLGAASAGAKWQVVGVTPWLANNHTETGIPTGTYTVQFQGIPGWTKPLNRTVVVNKDETNEFTGTYQLSTASETWKEYR